MEKRNEHSDFERGQVIGAFLFNHSKHEIAEKFNIPRTTVRRIISDYENNQNQPRPRTGRPRKTTPTTDRALCRMATRSADNRRVTLSNITASLNSALTSPISVSTAARRLYEQGIHARVPSSVPLTSTENRAERVKWARDHLKWTLADWKKILWSDESRVAKDGPDGGIKVWRRKHEAMHPDCLAPTAQHTPGVIVWGCASWHGLGPLVFLDGSINQHSYSELLETHVYPTMLVMFEEPEGGIFQQDNAPAHKSRTALTKLEELDIDVLEWPARSPDLSPIENVWRTLKFRLRKRPRPQKTANLRTALEEEWATIAADTACWRPFFENIHERLLAVIKSHGYPIKH